MKKGITPIIATIIMLLITVALAGAAWTFISGYFTGMTAQTIQLVDYTCIGGGGSNNARIMIRNSGTASISLGTCNTANTITGASAFTCGNMTIVKTAGGNLLNGEMSANTLPTGQVVTFTEDCASATTCNYRFTTTSGVGGPSPAVATIDC